MDFQLDINSNYTESHGITCDELDNLKKEICKLIDSSLHGYSIHHGEVLTITIKIKKHERIRQEN